MWVCAIAYIIGRRWSIYEKQVPTRIDSPAHYGDFAKDLLEEISVREIFQPDSDFHYVKENLTLREFIPTMTEVDQQNFPVVNEKGEMTGVFSINDIRDILVERDLDNLLIMKEVANEDIPFVTLDEHLGDVLRKFTENEVDTLPVVEREDRAKLLGMIRRRDVLRSYYEKLSAMRRISDGT
jgi:CIC family chloride channel protein